VLYVGDDKWAAQVAQEVSQLSNVRTALMISLATRLRIMISVEKLCSQPFSTGIPTWSLPAWALPSWM
jgi:hypothetical protein